MLLVLVLHRCRVRCVLANIAVCLRVVVSAVGAEWLVRWQHTRAWPQERQDAQGVQGTHQLRAGEAAGGHTREHNRGHTRGYTSAKWPTCLSARTSCMTLCAPNHSIEPSVFCCLRLCQSMTRIASLKSAAALCDMLQDVCYNADGSQVISCSSDATVRIWDAKTCEQLHGFRWGAATACSCTAVFLCCMQWSGGYHQHKPLPGRCQQHRGMSLAAVH
jgi:hypothetical protein